jgi:hypothetical protein
MAMGMPLELSKARTTGEPLPEGHLRVIAGGRGAEHRPQPAQSVQLTA